MQLAPRMWDGLVPVLECVNQACLLLSILLAKTAATR